MEEVCHGGGGWGVGGGVLNAQARPGVSLFLLPADPDVELSAASPAPCLPYLLTTLLATMLIMD